MFLSSISTSLIVLAITPFLDLPLTAKICMTVAVILLVYRHKENIKRIKIILNQKSNGCKKD